MNPSAGLKLLVDASGALLVPVVLSLARYATLTAGRMGPSTGAAQSDP